MNTFGNIDPSKYLENASRNSADRWKWDGFAMLPTRLLFDKNLDRTMLLIYWVLRAHTFKNKASCHLSLTTLARESRYSRNSVILAIKKLEKLGYVRVRRGKESEKKSNQYYLIQKPP
jgi:DNA-binding MarR family transcriptional regulator